MTALTQETIRSLNSFRPEDGSAVVSLYLDVDGGRYVRAKDYEIQLDGLVRSATEAANGHRPARNDLARIEAHVKAGIDRSGVRGLALFACSSADLWEVVELPVPVRNQVVVNATPHIRQLEAVLDENERFGVLLADKQRARMFVFELGVLVDRSEVFDELPRHEDDGGEWDRDHLRDHTSVAVQRHLKRAAAVAFSVFQGQEFDHLIVGAPDEIANELEACLHPYLRTRVAARVSVPVASSEAVIRQAALEVEEGVERAKEAALVTRLRGSVGAGGGAAGLAAVLSALVERRVDTLLVSDGYEAVGWRCPGCEFLATVGPDCPVCSQSMTRCEDVVEEAVEEALTQSCKVEFVVANADLDVLGRIGALLRF